MYSGPLSLSEYDYSFPRELIAAYPAEPRESARLMVVDRASGTISHRTVADLPDYFAPEDVLLVNNTQVYPARLLGEREATGAKVEVFLLREQSRLLREWVTLVGPARKARVGDRIRFHPALAALVLAEGEAGVRTVRLEFEGPDEALFTLLDEIGHVPLPPYLGREEEEGDRARYQTIFASERGAVAAPTAGLHFTPALLDRVKAGGTAVCPVTLHVGLGTFRSIEHEDVTQHRMDEEFFSISPDTAQRVNAILQGAPGRITAVGTTVVRAVESSLTPGRLLQHGEDWTGAYIYPPYPFAIVQRLMTNFHMPKTTLLLLISAFAGWDLMREAYAVAVRERYRLFSFGDAMLIL